MKKLIIATGMLSTCFTFCFTSIEAQDRDAVINGKVGTNIPYLIVAVPTQYGINTKIDTAKSAPDGAFKYTLKIKAAQSVYLNYGDNKRSQLWVRPGDRLTIDLQSKVPVFKGPDAIFANYYIGDKNLWIKVYNDYKKKNPHFDDANNRFTDNYFAIQDSISNERRNFLKNYFRARTDKDVQEFIKQQSLSFLYMDIYYKMAFDGFDIEKFKFYQDRYHIKRPTFEVLSDKVDFKDKRLFSIDYYRSFFCAAVGDIARKRIKDSGEKFSFNKYVTISMAIIDELAGGANTGTELKAIFLNDLEIEVLMDRNLDKANAIYSAISVIPGSATNTSLKMVKDKIDKIVLETKFNKGVKAPDFAFRDTAGKTYRLDDFKGKKILIDIGASWCGPCVASIPAWNKLVETNNGNKNVIFISLSMDDKESEWKEFLKKHNVNGMNLYAGEGGFKGSFAINYNIFAIPHFLLIDEEGKMLAYSAPSPESDEISTLLQKSKPSK